MFERLIKMFLGSSVPKRVVPASRHTIGDDGGAFVSNASWMSNGSDQAFGSSASGPQDSTVPDCDPPTDSESSFDAGACDSGFDGGGGDSGGGGASGDF